MNQKLTHSQSPAGLFIPVASGLPHLQFWQFYGSTSQISTPTKDYQRIWPELGMKFSTDVAEQSQILLEAVVHITSVKTFVAGFSDFWYYFWEIQFRCYSKNSEPQFNPHSLSRTSSLSSPLSAVLYCILDVVCSFIMDASSCPHFLAKFFLHPIFAPEIRPIRSGQCFRLFPLIIPLFVQRFTRSLLCIYKFGKNFLFW